MMVSSSGNSMSVRLDKGQFVGRDVIFQNDWLVQWHPSKFSQPLADIFRVHMQTQGDFVRIRKQVARLLAQQQRGKRWIVVDNDAVLPIDNAAARRQYRDVSHAVLFRQLRVIVLAANL